MDHNEITMFMDAKVDIQDKRPETVNFYQWIRCQVTIEAVKCLPCFLRITFEPRADYHCRSSAAEEHKPKNFTISINVPGVVITVAASRTKQHSYAVSWIQNRKHSYIYFALETELSCRRHMKWLKKSIRNLELYRKIMLEDRRTSRGVAASSTLVPLPLLPCDFDESSTSWPHRVSEIYEEIFDENQQEHRDSQRLSRRYSRTSIASGIYEEMKPPFNASNNFESINEEMFSIPSTPPPLPPLPTQRKRFNTYEPEEPAENSFSEDIPRCSTNPETEMAKKKKYKNVLETFFYGGGLRSKRTASASNSSKQQIAENSVTTTKTKPLFKPEFMEKATSRVVFPSPSPPPSKVSPVYANDDAIAAKRQKKPMRLEEVLEKHSKRNSFSSPDLSKINFVDTFDEQRIAEILSNSYSRCEELDFGNSASLDETELMLTKTNRGIPTIATLKSKANNPFEDRNISQRISKNFNFSACNSSAINLIAPLSSQPNQMSEKNRIIFDDLSGYCVMAPIVKKMSAIDNTPLPKKSNCVAQPLESISSGYSTGTSTSSSANSTEEPNLLKQGETQPTTITEESIVYENMQVVVAEIRQDFPKSDPTAKKLDAEFSGSLYENLLAVKAAQELEQIPITRHSSISTSTPMDSPLLAPVTPTGTTTSAQNIEDENYYQTPRKSIISIDEKVPSYYPNTCESSVRSRRRSYSPAQMNTKNISEQKTPTSTVKKSSGIAITTPVLRQFINTKMRHDRKENIYLSSPQDIIEQRRKSKANAVSSTKADIGSKTSKTMKTGAHKISENVYAVTHCLKKSAMPYTNCNNNIENKPLNNDENVEGTEHKLQSEIIHLAILQKIDFKFEDNVVSEMGDLDKEIETITTTPTRALPSSTQQLQRIQMADSNQKMLINNDRHSPAANVPMSQSTITNNENVGAVDNHLTAGIKKFTSLPRFKRFNLSPLRMRINNVLQRNHTPDL